MGVVSPKQAVDPLVLAIDVGTSSVRAAFYDGRGQLVEDVGAQIEGEPHLTRDGGAEMDPDDLFERTARAVDEALAEAGELRDRIAAVSTSTFWHGVLGVGPDGRATTPLYIWADSRSRDEMAGLKAQLDERAVHGRTGCPLHWSYWPAKLRWLANESPDAVGRTRTWMSFGEYLHLRIFGRTVCSLSMASGTGLLDQNAKTWDPEVLDATGVRADQLAPLGDLDRPLTEPRAAYARRWPPLRDVPWYPAVGDGACSNVGSGCVTQERMALMVGTSGALRVAWRGDRATIPWGAWCYRIDGNRFVMGGALTNGGNLFAWMRDTLKLAEVEEVERDLAAMQPDAHGLTVLPFLAGERSPGYAAEATAAILGLTLATRPVDILRAGLEAVALRFALLHEIVSDEASKAREVVATGGALLNSPAWVQMMADALGRPVVISDEPEASSRGAALLALEQLGAIESIEAVPAGMGRTYRPNPGGHAKLAAAQKRHRRYYEELVARHQE
jgi:gluconokinase